MSVDWNAQERADRLADLYILSSAVAMGAESGQSGSGRVIPLRDLYFIQVGNDGPVKIGVAGNVQARMANLQTASPYELVLRGRLPGLGALERHVHWDFGSNRIRGEWFQPTPAILDMAEGRFPEDTVDRRALAPMPADLNWGDVDRYDLEDIATRFTDIAVACTRWRQALDWWRFELKCHKTIGEALAVRAAA